jgi:hypothetical protein
MAFVAAARQCVIVEDIVQFCNDRDLGRFVRSGMFRFGDAAVLVLSLLGQMGGGDVQSSVNAVARTRRHIFQFVSGLDMDASPNALVCTPNSFPCFLLPAVIKQFVDVELMQTDMEYIIANVG